MARLPRQSQVRSRYFLACPSSPARRHPPAPPTPTGCSSGCPGTPCLSVAVADEIRFACLCATLVVLRQSLTVAPRNLNAYKGVTRYGLSHASIKSTWIALPPLSEQAAIARYLDHADRRIRRCTHAKEKLVKLLEEQRQALVNEAVTGRFDVRTGQPYSAYRDAGVDWLGSVPRHWNVHRARYVFRDIDKRSVDGKEQHLSMSQRLGLVPSHLIENRTLVSESYAGGKLCRSGDLVLNRLKAHLGVFAVAKQSGVISPDYTVLRPNTDARPEYLEHVLRSPSCRGELRTRAKGIVEGFWRLYTDDFFEIRLPLPPRHEQSSIVAWISSFHARSDRIVAHAHREIDLLREYRTRLIADIVSGKLDVREAPARVMDEAEKSESTAGSAVQADIGYGPDRELTVAAQQTEL